VLHGKSPFLFFNYYNIIVLTLQHKNTAQGNSCAVRAKTNGLFAPLKEIIKQELSFILSSKLNFYYIRNMDFHCIFKGFDEKLRLLYSCTATLEFLHPKNL